MPLFSRVVVTAALTFLSASALSAQEVRPRILSPRDSTRQEIGQANVVVDYGRPSKRRRTIFGALVPYGVVWRTGANEATHLRTDREIIIGGARVPRGTYTLWTIPERESWTLIINRATGQWGTDYDKSQDLARVPMKVTTLDESVEQFTIAIARETARSGVLTMTWDMTQASVPIQVEK